MSSSSSIKLILFKQCSGSFQNILNIFVNQTSIIQRASETDTYIQSVTLEFPQLIGCGLEKKILLYFLQNWGLTHFQFICFPSCKQSFSDIMFICEKKIPQRRAYPRQAHIPTEKRENINLSLK